MIAELLMFTFVASAADKLSTEEVCTPVEPKLEKSIDLRNDVNFFVRPSVKTGEVSVGTGHGNRVYQVADGQHRDIPGTLDPVLTPDGALVTVPGKTYYDGEKGKFPTLAEAD